MNRHALIVVIGFLCAIVFLSSRAASAEKVPPTTILTGAADFERFGWSVGSAGDVNGDGYEELIVSAIGHSADFPHQGIVYLYPGSAQGIGTTPVWSYKGNAAWASAGIHAAAAGDVNNDGFDDIVFAAEGTFSLFLGGPAWPTNTPQWLSSKPPLTTYIGQTINAAGDVNGDGYDDVVVGSSNKAFIYYGENDGLNEDPAWSISLNRVAMSISGAGDVNGDGYDDIIVSDHYGSDGIQREGRAYVFHGSATAPSKVPDWSFASGIPSAFAGKPVLGAGDLNGDGFDDVAIAAYQAATTQVDAGRVYIFYGSPTGLSNMDTIDGANIGDFWGFSLYAAGDLTQDGYDDLVVGSPYATVDEVQMGRVKLYAGSAAGIDPTQVVSLIGIAEREFFGFALGGVDADGNGVRELVVSAPFAVDNGKLSGNVTIYADPSASATGATHAEPLNLNEVTDATMFEQSAALNIADVAIESGNFTDVSAEARIDNIFPDTFGAMWLDINRDNLQDLIFLNHGNNPSIHLNLDGNIFRNVSGLSGLPLDPTRYVGELDRHGAACADFNDDEFYDLLITRGANRTDSLGFKVDELLTYDPVDERYRFEREVDTKLNNSLGRGRTVSWVDVNNDGELDVYIGNETSPNILYTSNGDGTFSDTTEAAGLLTDWRDYTAAWFDYDDDGWTDVILAGNRVVVYRNQQDGTFEDVSSQTQLNPSAFVRAMSWGDFDNDGDQDIAFATNEDVQVWRKRSDGRFTKAAAGGNAALSVNWADIDNDADLDLLILNEDKILLVVLELGGIDRFELVSGATTAGTASPDLALADYNLDGYLDVAVGTAQHRLLRNEYDGNSWLTIGLKGTQSTTDGYGTVVEVTTGSRVQTQQYTGDNAARHTMSCTPLHFGLGDATTADVKVTWPSGEESQLFDLPVNSVITISEPSVPDS